MTTKSEKMQFNVQAKRLDSHGSSAICKQAELILDTDLAGRADAFNPAELLLASLAACIIKGIERVTPILNFKFTDLEIKITGVRQDVPPKMESIYYEILVSTDETDRRLELLHENVKKYGTVFNTLTLGTELDGTLKKAECA